MLRLLAVTWASVLVWATLDLRPVAASTPTFDGGGGVASTATALRRAVAKLDIDGHVWLGKLRGVGGGRDTVIYVPRELRASRAIEVVVYMEGHGSFAAAAMDHRHAASIARLRGNRVYVAPDAPSSAHGQRKARTPYWQAGCAERRCAGGHGAPGDFIVFLSEVRAHIARIAGIDPDQLALDLSLIGFSNGGKGIGNALAQLADAGFLVGGTRVRLADVIFADGNYGATALADAWRILAELPEVPRLTILVAHGGLDTRDAASGNRRRAAAFLKAMAPNAASRVRVVPLRGGHHAIGDAAIDYLRAPTQDLVVDERSESRRGGNPASFAGRAGDVVPRGIDVP